MGFEPGSRRSRRHRRIAPVSRSTTRSSTPSGGRPAESRRHSSGSVHWVAGDDRQLRCAVSLQPSDARPSRHGLGDAAGHWRGPPQDEPQRGEVVGLEAAGGWPSRARSERPPSPTSCARPRFVAGTRRDRTGCAAAPWSPASAAASRLRRPRMCDGGVATWKRSSGPSPRQSTQWRVPCTIERCVWRTAFGSPVVPELKTSTASAPSLIPGKDEVHACDRSVHVDVGHRKVLGQQLDARPSATACTGAVSSSVWRTSTAFHAGLIKHGCGTDLADGMDDHGELHAVAHHHRDPISRARRRRRAGRWANPFARRSRSTNDQRSSPARSASRCRTDRPTASRPECINVDRHPRLLASVRSPTAAPADCTNVGTACHRLIGSGGVEGERAAVSTTKIDGEIRYDPYDPELQRRPVSRCSVGCGRRRRSTTTSSTTSSP